MFKNKRGFTLIEFLAVIVVLAIIILIATNVVLDKVEKSRKNSTEVNANNYVRAVNGVASLSQNEGEDMEEGTFDVSDLNSGKVNISGEKPKAGYVIISNYEVVVGCLEYDKYRAVITGGKTTMVDLEKCVSLDETYAYTGNEKTFTASIEGWYKLETWGAQGGESYYNSYHSDGGYGGYSVGYIYLNKNDKLYINVGGQGAGVNYAQSSGNVTFDSNTGYNGGGYAGIYSNNSSHGGGGGATSIALSSGLLTAFKTNQSQVVIVAGGGGGASTHSSYPNYSGAGGSGGGSVGGSGIPASSQCYNYGNGGSQNAVGGHTSCTVDGTLNRYEQVTPAPDFGKGSDYTTNSQGSSYAYSGGGGGYYGGQSGYHAPGGGGSGYVGSGLLYGKEMYCYNCTESSSVIDKTTKTTCSDTDPKEKCVKKGNGYAKISYYSGTVAVDSASFEFAFTNGQSKVRIPKTGTYRLEAWGAQGGNANGYTGGYGAYSVGEIHLTEGTYLYVNVGEAGTSSKTEAIPATYNGGGAGLGGDCSTYTNRWGSSGGGATSIAAVSGQIKNLSELKDKPMILIVAGGGGGAYNIDGWYAGNGGSGGGAVGMPGSLIRYEVNYPTAGGSQDAGGHGGTCYSTEAINETNDGKFGVGGSSPSWSCGEGAGGGGGFYGGGGGYSASGAGGSGYIANLTNAEMYCYNCTNDSTPSKKTTTTNLYDANPTPQKAKAGNGYAKITLIN